MTGSIPVLGIFGVLAPMVERPFCTRKVMGSNPMSSSKFDLPYLVNYTFQIIFERIYTGCLILALGECYEIDLNTCELNV